MTAAERVKAQAKAIGFSRVGISRAEPLVDEAKKLDEWLARGYHATMAWMERSVEKRADPRAILPGAHSVIALALNYYTPYQHSSDAATGRISRYAWGDDYHDIVSERMELLRVWMEKEFPGSKGIAYVDTGPMMDKAWAQKAGIGWLGKHTNVITQEFGSWVFLGEIITTADLDPDGAFIDHCGTCTLCIEACPTRAIVEPYVVDSSRCISYLTIEHRGEFTAEESEMLGQWIYGCDVCQDVCPWNHRFAKVSDESTFQDLRSRLKRNRGSWNPPREDNKGCKRHAFCFC